MLKLAFAPTTGYNKALTLEPSQQEIAMSRVAFQIDHFRQFALSRIESSTDGFTIDDLYDEWRLENPEPSQLADDARAVSASITDYRNGVPGKSSIGVIDALNSKLFNK